MTALVNSEIVDNDARMAHLINRLIAAAGEIPEQDVSLGERMLSLHVDGRYNAADMDRIAELLEQFDRGATCRPRRAAGRVHQPQRHRSVSSRS